MVVVKSQLAALPIELAQLASIALLVAVSSSMPALVHLTCPSAQVR
jgi:hypothetical protein